MSAFCDGDIDVWNPIAGVHHRSFPNPIVGRIAAVAISYSGLLIVVMGTQGGASVLDADTGKVLKKLRPSQEGAGFQHQTISFSPNDKWLGIMWRKNVVDVWDMKRAEGRMSGLLPSLVPLNDPSSIAFSSNEQWLAVARADRVYLWDVMTGTLRKTWICPSSPSRIHVSFANDYTIVTRTGLLDLKDCDQMTDVSPEFRGCGFHYDDPMSWITWNGRKALWLPSEYRPGAGWDTAVVATNMVAIACSSGRVLVIRFSPDTDNYLDR